MNATRDPPRLARFVPWLPVLALAAIVATAAWRAFVDPGEPQFLVVAVPLALATVGYVAVGRRR